MTLDALLAASLFDSGESVENAHTKIPLRNTRGLWHGSAAFYDPLEVGSTAFVANLRATHDLDPTLVFRNKNGAIHTKLSLLKRREFGAVMNTYRHVVTDAVTWYGEGDIERVESLLHGLSFIGKRRASGFGEVGDIEISPSEIDGVVGLRGEPLRPVPLELFAGDRNSIRGDAAWCPAYWRPENRAVCFVPSPS